MNSFEKIKEILVDSLSLNADDVTLDADLVEDLGADSLSLIEMLMDFEETYNVTIPDESFENVKTVGDIVEILDSLEIS